MAERSDVELLEELLARENRLVSAYEAALRRDAIEASLGETLRDHEREHVRGIEQALEGRGPRNPRASVPSPELTASLRSRESFARFAIALERQTVAAYTESVPSIRDARLRQPLGSIMACGAAHVVALRNSLAERSLVDYPE
jgi:rubrerythrin